MSFQASQAVCSGHDARVHVGRSSDKSAQGLYLMGHAAKSVTRRSYVGDDLARLRDAVESITLDLTTGQVIALPLAAVGGAPPTAALTDP
jgi:hypothetical protein